LVLQEKRGLHFTYVHPIIIDPKDPATVYAGTDRAHGVYKFPSSGTDWVEMSNGFDKDALNIYALAIDPNNTQILYASNNKGLYKTTNGAQSWTKLPLEGTEYNLASIRSIAVDPKTSAVYIASTYGLAVEKSIDGGYTWVQLSNGLPRLDVNYITVSKHESRPIRNTNFYIKIKSLIFGPGKVNPLPCLPKCHKQYSDYHRWQEPCLYLPKWQSLQRKAW